MAEWARRWRLVRLSLSRATNRLLTFGLSSSPLLVSTQRTEIGLRPMRARASEMGRSTQTPLDLK